jgi:hypothetical protein
MTMTTLFRSLACGLLLTLTGCGSTHLTDAWQSPKFQGKQLDNVLVVGVTPNKTKRILFERGFVSALSEKGIKSTASIDVIGSATPTRESVGKYLAKSNIQYVIVSQYSGKETTAEYVPEAVRTYYTGPYYPSYGSYWNHNDTTTMTREAYVSTRSKVILTTSIYNVKSEELVWVGRSNSFEPSSISSASNELAKRIVDRIEK